MASKKAPTKKTTTKKTTAPAPAPVAGAKRPSYKANVAANQKLTERKTLFFKFPVGTTVMRILPPMDGSGIIYPLTSLHYKVQSFDDPQRNIAPACLKVHGDGNCYICNFLEYLKGTGDPVMMGIGDELFPTTRCNAQAFIWSVATKTWEGPKIVALPAAVAQNLATLLSVAEDTGMPQFCDPEHGQSIAVTRTGDGKFGTKYASQPTGRVVNLFNEIPNWESLAFSDLMGKLDIKILDIDQQKERLVTTFPDLPWEHIEDAIG